MVCLFARGLVFAGYLLALLLPGLALAGRPSGADHAQMMAMAGHAMAMPGMEMPQMPGSDMAMAGMGGAQMLLCQQHCLVAVATLPVADQSVEILAHPIDMQAGGDAFASSLAVPPPGHPPKTARI